MAHNDSKQKWESLSNKEKENLWLREHGSRIIPANVTGADLDRLFKNVNYETKKDQSNSLGGGIPD